MAKKQYKFRLIHEICLYHWHFLFIVMSAFGIIISLLSGLVIIVLPNPNMTNLYIIRNIFFGSLGLAVLWAVLSLIGKIKIRLEEV